MASPVTVNCLIELEKFTSQVKDCMDLFSSADALAQYCFGGTRSLCDVVRRACEDASQVQQCRDIVNDIAHHVHSEITTMTSKMCASGMVKQDFEEYKERLSMFFEIFKTTAVEEIKNPELESLLNSTVDTVASAYSATKSFPSWGKLKGPVLAYFTRGSLPIQELPALRPVEYARDDGVISSIAFEKAQDDTLMMRTRFLSILERMLNNIIAKNASVKAMRELVEEKATFDIEDSDAEVYFEKFMVVHDMALDANHLDPAVPSLYTALLRKFFLLISLESKNLVAKKLFEHYSSKNRKLLPNLENFISNYQEGLTGILNELPSDHTVLNSNMNKFEDVRNSLLWYLFATPVTSVHQLLSLCIENRGYVIAVVKSFYSFPALFQLSVVLPGNEDREPEPLLVSSLRRIFCVQRHRWENSQNLENLMYLAMSFSARRKQKNEKAASEIRPVLLDSVELMNWIVSEILRKRDILSDGSQLPYEVPTAHIQALTLLLYRMFSTNQGNKETLFKWSTTVGENYRETGAVQTPELVKLVYDLLIKYDGPTGAAADVADNCRLILKTIGRRLREDEVRFDKGTVSFLMEKCFDNGVWWLKFAICSWLSYPLNEPKRQIPSGLYRTLPEDERDMFDVIATTDEASAAECFLLSLMELGLFDVDLAISQLQLGIEEKLRDEDVIEKISLALVDCCGKNFSRRRIVDIGKLLHSILDFLDPSRCFKTLENWSAWLFEGIRQVEYLLIVSRSARIGFEKRDVAFSRDMSHVSEHSFDRIVDHEAVALLLLETFCEMAKTHIDKEIQEVQKMRSNVRHVLFQTPDLKKEGWQLKMKLERKEQQILFQLTCLFNEACCFTRHVTKIPQKLQVLLTSIVDALPDVQKASANRALDDHITEAVKTNTVYAFAKCLATPDTPVPAVTQTENSVKFDVPTSHSASSEAHSHVSRPAVAAVAPQRTREATNSYENKLFSGSDGGGSSRHGQSPRSERSTHSRDMYDNDDVSRGPSYSQSYHGRESSASRHNSTRPRRTSHRSTFHDPQTMRAADREDFNNYSKKWSTNVSSPKRPEYFDRNRNSDDRRSNGYYNNTRSRRQSNECDVSGENYSYNLDDVYSSYERYERAYRNKGEQRRGEDRMMAPMSRDSHRDSRYSSSEIHGALSQISQPTVRSQVERNLSSSTEYHPSETARGSRSDRNIPNNRRQNRGGYNRP